MSVNNPYVVFLAEKLDPLIMEMDENASILDAPILNLLRRDTIDGGDVSDKGVIDLYQSDAKPSVFQGDEWEYIFGDVEEKYGKQKTKKITIAIHLNKKEYKKLRRTGKVSSLIRKKILAQMRKSKMFATVQVKKWFFGKFGTSSMFYDPGFISPMSTSSSNTLSDPNDMNSGSTLDKTAIIWSGSQQTYKNVETFANAVMQLFVKTDTNTDVEIPFRRFTWIVNPNFYVILNNTKDIKTSTDVSDNTYIEDLRSAGIDVVKDNQGATYTYGDGNAHTSFIVADIEEFEIDPVSYDLDDDAWSEWKEIYVQKGATGRFIYVKIKEVEFTFLTDAWGVNDTLYKKVLEVSTTPFDDTA